MAATRGCKIADLSIWLRSLHIPILFLFLCGLPEAADAQSACGVSIGAVVQVINTGTQGLRVRSGAGTSYMQTGGEFNGAIGTVQSSSTSANGFNWWQIRWNDGSCTVGYSAEGDGAGTCYLQAISSYTASLSSPAASASVTFPQTFSWSSSCSLRLAFATSANPSTLYYLADNLNSLNVSAADWSSVKSSIGTASTYYWTAGEVIGSYFYARAAWRPFTEVVAPPTHTLTVASSNPNSGVVVSSSTVDNNGNYGGSTPLSRTFNQNTTATYTAPSTAGGNTFQKWQKDGVDLTTSTTASITMDTDHTITAIYATPCSFSLSPSANTGASYGGTASSGSVTVTTSSGCPWTADNGGNSWITITSGSSGNVSGTVNYSVAANTTGSPRQGYMNIAGQSFLVVQSSVSVAITIISPNGGENWTAGVTHTISWTVSGTSPSPISYFGMDYSLDGGTTWQLYGYFATGSASSGSWLVPSTIASSHARVEIIAVNSQGIAMFWGTSANDFTISSPTGNPTAVPTCDNHAPLSGQQVNFNSGSSTSSGSGCSITSYSWNFGDGTTSTSANPSHTFFSPAGSSASYTVSLQITDSCGKTDTKTLSIYVTGQALGNNQTQPTSQDPVNLATGNYTYNHTDLQISSRGFPFEFKRFYNSKATASTGFPLGFGWTHSYNIYLSINSSNSAVIAFGDGHQETYATNGAGGFVSEPGIFNILTTASGTYTLTSKEQQKYNFNSQGQLTSITDKNGNTLNLTYAGNNLTTITDTVSRVINFTYNANNCLTNISDPLGRTIQFAYDANTNLIQVTDAGGGITQYGYDLYHQLTNAIDPRAITFVTMIYDTEKRVVSSQKDALQGATTFNYDFVNGVTTVTDAMGNVSYNYYDSLLRVVKAVDNLGNTESFQYDTNNNRTMVIDKNGAVTSYGYDANGNVISKTDSFTNTTTIAYDNLNNPTNRLNALTGKTVFHYDTKGNLTNSLNALGKANSIRYDAFGEPVVVTDANGNSTTNAYDSFGNLIVTKDALGDTNAFTYDAVSRKLSQIDALGHTNRFYYDNADNVVTNVNALGKASSSTYDGDNNRIFSIDFNGNTTTNVYDQKNRLIIVYDALGDSGTNTYDALDHKIQVVDARGNATEYAYDTIGNLIAITNAVGGITRYAYDPNGNRTNMIDALGNSTTYVFDSLNRLTFTQDALGHTAASVYDPLGRRIQRIDALNHTNFFSYDAMGHLTNFMDAVGGMVKYIYDNVGNRISVTDPNGNTTTNIFDALNRLVKTTDPDGGVLQLAYDAAGNLVRRTDPNGSVTTYLYDANNRRTKITYPTGTPVTLAYDSNGNRTNMTDSLGVTTYSYDALNRLKSVVDCYGKAVGYGYDKNGNRTSVVYPASKTVSYIFDPMNRMASVSDWLGHTTTYAYDADGNLTNSVNPNGTSASYRYDTANRLIALTNADNSAIISSYAYTLDAVGNHTQVNQTEQLQTTPIVSQSAYAYDNDNRMTNSEGQTQTFDSDGDMISIGGGNTLSYDFENRLTQTIFAGSTNNYQYDGAGNRLSANRNGVVARYVLDRESPLTQVLAETDSGGNATAYYIYGMGLISRIDSGGNANYYHYDSRGSTIALTDGSGQILEAYAYDPFGRPINGLISDNRFRYLGRHGVMDEENGFLYIRARYYSTKRGRFTTKDPTTGKDGDSQGMNRYIYALNNPVRLIDISGLSAQETSGNPPTFATSDNSLLHNYLISPSTGGLATQMAGSTPSILPQNNNIALQNFLTATAAELNTIQNSSAYQRTITGLYGLGETYVGVAAVVIGGSEAAAGFVAGAPFGVLPGVVAAVPGVLGVAIGAGGITHGLGDIYSAVLGTENPTDKIPVVNLLGQFGDSQGADVPSP
jgi:RHS repeat-associated protein